jgi:hypothetical protein
VGSEAATFEVGDEVVGVIPLDQGGGCAEYAILKVYNIIKKPKVRRRERGEGEGRKGEGGRRREKEGGGEEGGSHLRSGTRWWQEREVGGKEERGGKRAGREEGGKVEGRGRKRLK